MTQPNTEQLRASNPFDSVWVSASAGTGKTKVLTDRVLRLLLQVSEPEKILCLTFTKAAAAEMENRINNVLKKWATCPVSELTEKIVSLTQEEPDEDLIEKARSLFSKKLEAAGGMKIMTIHSFCQAILKRFPLEADVPPHFEVLDDLVAKTMKEEILNQVISSQELKKNLQELLYFLSMNNLSEFLGRILNESSMFQALIERFPGGLQSVIFSIKQYFNITKYQSEKQIINENFSEDEWMLKKEFYLTKDETIRSKKKEDSQAILVWETNERLKIFKTIQATEILLSIAFRVIEKYETFKAQNAFLDYTDLIEKTKNLLSRSSMASWVLYKLDGGIDHILVDEAQDTNRSQWAIIQSIAEEFFSGDDEKNLLRTLFVVGDKKQSIFSFQGADPTAFEEMRNFFEKRILDSQNSFLNIPLNYSFRSTEPILRLVNFILKNTQAKDGVLADFEEAFHLANRADDAGIVEIWPIEENKKADAPDPWKPPIERQENDSAMKRLVYKIAARIHSMVGHEILSSQNRLIEPSDILILLQKRGTMMAEIVRALREYHIPVAGVDRLILSDHLAIQDLIAIAEFALQPQNDLNLANLIKSPLLNLTEDDLYNICVNRGEKTIWQRLQKLYPKKANLLKEILNSADQKPPFEFFSNILGTWGGRKKFITRFGFEVNEALDEFLNLTLKFEQTNTPSLQLFLTWFSCHEIEIKRDLDNSGINAVRIMTVHGSKGLQGNIVFLPDTRGSKTKPPIGGDFIWLPPLNLPLWIPNVKMRPHALTEFFIQKEHLINQEKRRLLYVALTRACDQLYICGYGKGGANNWYDLIKNSLPEHLKNDDKSIIRWDSPQKRNPSPKKSLPLKYDFLELPGWAIHLPKEETREPKPLSPSKLGEKQEDVPTESALNEQQNLALKRGVFLHQLLQFLPTLPENKRAEYAQKHCPADVTIPENFISIFKDPNLKEIFGKNSLAEVPVVGKVNGEMFSGQIDRLVILPNEIKIIDFKTNQFVPKKVPDLYKKQLNAYRDLLKTIFPDRMIKTYILWTQTLYFEEVK